MNKKHKAGMATLLGIGIAAICTYSPIKQHKEYLEQLTMLTEVIRYEYTQESCIPNLKTFEIIEDDENRRRAFERANNICTMDDSELRSSALLYRWLGIIWKPYKKLSADMYYYSYHIYENFDSLLRLKAMGENVATTVPTDAAFKVLVEDSKKDHERVKEALKISRESVNESEKFLEMHRKILKISNCSNLPKSCEPNQIVRTIPNGEEDCFEQKTVSEKLQHIDCRGNVHFAWMNIRKSAVLGGADKKTAISVLRYQGLSYLVEDNRKLLFAINRHKINDANIQTLFQNAIEWSETEKNKSAEYLYGMAHNPNEMAQYSEEYRDNIQTSYLRLAAQKGHPKAKKEIKLYLDAK